MIGGPRRVWTAALLAGAGVLAVSAATPAPQSAPSDLATHVMYVTPVAGLSTPATSAAQLRAAFGEGPGVKLGFAEYLHISMPDWTVDASASSAEVSVPAIRAALAPLASTLDSQIAAARGQNLVLVVELLSAIRDRVDPLQTAAQVADRRNMQWYADGQLAPGWITYSRYARTLRRQYAAYVREVGRILSERRAAYPETLVAVSGDGESELALDRGDDPGGPVVADYSPFTILEFRDWLRGRGMYDVGQPLAGQAYAHASRYYDDPAPHLDGNGDGRTLATDFGVTATTWSLRYEPWELSDPENALAIPASTYGTDGWTPLEAFPGGFDAPRTHAARGVNAWWDVFDDFRRQLVWHYVRDFATWITTAVDSEGRTFPASAWYSYQVPADYLHGQTPASPDTRLLTSASPWWTANIAPLGNLGLTVFGVNRGGGRYARTAPGLFGAIRSCGVGEAPPQCLENSGGLAGARWGIFEWNPSIPHTTDPTVYRDEMRRIRQLRPTIVAPYRWQDSTDYKVRGTGFQTALAELIEQVKDGWVPATAVDRTTFRFAAARGGSSLAYVSAPQTLRLTMTGGGTVDWTATTDATWLTVSPSSGHGDATMTLSVNGGAAWAPQGTYTLTIATPGGNPASHTIAVTLVLESATHSGAPFGLVDTPTWNSTQRGIIGVTGWALDDLGVEKVSIYRQHVPGIDGPNAYLDEFGYRLVPIGDAVFLPDARPDVEAAYFGYPNAQVAGWGLSVLTNMMPHRPAERGQGGQGSFQFFAVAQDLEGHRSLLGPTLAEATPIPVTLDNDTLNRPFGAMDTPGQGGSVAGQAFANFGWVLTPPHDNAEINTSVVPITVYIDGQAVGTVQYNQCRGSNIALTGSSFLGPTVLCDDDVATPFRPGNYRNLDPGRGAIGAFVFDSTTMANGRHDIWWIATDTLGRSEGIGSRFFYVANTGTADAAPSLLGQAFAPPAGAPAASARQAVTAPVLARPVWVADRGRWAPVPAAGAQVAVDELLDVRLPPMPDERGRWQGYRVTAAGVRALPPGAHLVDARGRFQWRPFPGTQGRFPLMFVWTDHTGRAVRVPVTVTVTAASGS